MLSRPSKVEFAAMGGTEKMGNSKLAFNLRLRQRVINIAYAEKFYLDHNRTFYESLVESQCDGVFNAMAFRQTVV